MKNYLGLTGLQTSSYRGMETFDERNNNEPAKVNVEAVRSFLESLDEGRGDNIFNDNLPAEEQRRLFGKYYGRGKIFIDWNTGEIIHSIKVCFGNDFHITAVDNIFRED